MSLVADAWAPIYERPTGFRMWPNEALVKFVAGRKFGSALEVGCGNGANLWFLSEHAEIVFGLDGSEAALAACRDYMATRLAAVRQPVLRHGTIPPLPYGDGSMDLIVDCMTSQHVPWAQHEALYREYRRVVRGDGALFLLHLDGFSHPGGRSWTGQGFDYDALQGFDAPLFCLPPPDQLGYCLRAAGFRDIALGSVAYESRDWQTRDNRAVAHYTVATWGGRS